MILTNEQKRAIIEYISNYSVKSILEDVDEVGSVWTEENDSEIREAINNVLERCKERLLLNN